MFVLQRLASIESEGVEFTLVSPGRWQYYSGMIPGWIAGHYKQDQIRIDLEKLTSEAGVKTVYDRVVDIDAEVRSARLASGSQLHYDLISLDIGSETRRDRFEDCGKRLLTVKPFDAFQDKWLGLVEDAAKAESYNLVIAGAGAAGVELALSAQYALKKVCPRATVQIVTGHAGLLRGHSGQVREQALYALQNAGVELVADRATGTKAGVVLSSGSHLIADAVVAATGASAPSFLARSGLFLDEDGFVKVDRFHRSISHADVFAVGDVCSRDDPRFQRSGVHAVRVGPILASNLLAAIGGRPLKEYRPRKSALYLLGCGEKNAIASWGSFSAGGGWVWRWKDLIDRRFIARFS